MKRCWPSKGRRAAAMRRGDPFVGGLRGWSYASGGLPTPFGVYVLFAAPLIYIALVVCIAVSADNNPAPPVPDPYPTPCYERGPKE